MVPVVPTLADGKNRDNGILRTIDAVIVRVVAVEMGGAVDEPCEVEHRHVAKSAGHKIPVPERFTPAIQGHKTGENKAHEQRKPGIQCLLEGDDRVRLKVAMLVMHAVVARPVPDAALPC